MYFDAKHSLNDLTLNAGLRWDGRWKPIFRHEFRFAMICRWAARFGAGVESAICDRLSVVGGLRRDHSRHIEPRIHRQCSSHTSSGLVS